MKKEISSEEDEELISEGECLFCLQKFTQKEIKKHLAKHLSTMEKESQIDSAKTYCHIEVSVAEMFLHLLVNVNSKMKIIDEYLKDIWLECCGHLSDFGHKDYNISMNNKVLDVFQEKVKIFYDYDFGSTTRVFLKGNKNYNLNMKENVILLSRNEPLKLLCAICNKQPATQICIICNDEQYSLFCDKCSKIHAKTCNDFNDYAMSPVVNSPRMGVCGYTYGTIDVQRDGVYKL